MNIIKKGLTNSIGWNRGKKLRSIHLLEPFISMPIKGTKIKKINDIKKKITENFKRVSLSIEERKKIINTPSSIKIKCFIKEEEEEERKKKNELQRKKF